MRTGRYGEFRFAKKKDGDRLVWGVWTEYADTAGDTVAEETPYGLLCCLAGSGSDKDELYMPLVTGGTPVEGGSWGTQLVVVL